jgi:hypothetical protein
VETLDVVIGLLPIWGVDPILGPASMTINFHRPRMQRRDDS